MISKVVFFSGLNLVDKRNEVERGDSTKGGHQSFMMEKDLSHQ